MPKRAARCTASEARSGLPAPRFCPATAAAAPIRPTDVHVISENSWVYETLKAAWAAALWATDPMNASMNTPPTFIAMPWIPVGSPNRNKERMIPQSGPQPLPRGNDTTHPPLSSFHSAYNPSSPDASEVPIAAPAVPKAGRGPSP